MDTHITSLHADLATLCARLSNPTLPMRFVRLQHLSLESGTNKHPAPSEVEKQLQLLALHSNGLLDTVLELDLRACTGVTPGALAALLRACRALRRLHLPQPAPTPPADGGAATVDALAAAAATLTALLGAGGHVISPAALSSLARALPNLQELDLCASDPACIGSCRPAATTTAPPPTPQLDAPHLASLARLSALRALAIPASAHVAATCDLAAALPRLEALRFQPHPEQAPPPPLDAADLAPLARCPALQQLQLCSASFSPALALALSHTPVRSLRLLGPCAGEPSAAAALPLAAQLSDLALELPNSAAAAALARLLPPLRLRRLELTVFNAGGARLGGLLHAISCQDELQELELNIQYCPLLDADWAQCGSMPALRRLALRGHVGDAALLQLAAAAPGLQQLRLRGCCEVTPAGLGALARCAARLRELRLQLLRCATQGALTALVAAPALRRIELQACRNLSCEGCKEVAAAALAMGREIEVVRLR